MQTKTSIRLKLIGLIIGIIVITVLSVGKVAFDHSMASLEDQYQASLKAVVDLKRKQVESYFQNIKENITFGTQLNLVKEKIREGSPLVQDAMYEGMIEDAFPTSLDSLGLESDSLIPSIDPQPFVEARETLVGGDQNLKNVFGRVLDNFDIKNVILTKPDGEVIFIEGDRKKDLPKGKYFNSIDNDGNTVSAGRDSVYFSNVFFSPSFEKQLYVSAPVKNEAGNLLGVLIYDLDLEQVYEALQDSVGLGKTGEIQITKDFVNVVLRLNPSRGQNPADFTANRRISIGSPNAKHLSASAKGQSGQGLRSDINGRSVLAAWDHIPMVNWGISAQMESDEVFNAAYNLRFYLLIWGVIILFISFLLLRYILGYFLKDPLQKLLKFIRLLAEGILPVRLRSNSHDEIGEMTHNLNDLVENLKLTANFANQIGQENFEAEFKPVSDKDTLGMSLLSMRDSIRQSAERDDERNWIVTGLAEIGDILPSISTIEELGDLVSKFITNKIGAVQGAFYTVNDEEGKEAIIEMRSSYAYHKKKYLNGSFRFAEGLVGQAAVEQDIILRTEIPDDYITISSGILGDKKPKCILITPLITNETVYGILEFAGFQTFSHREVEFVKEISELIARTVFNIIVKESTEKLLRESQKMSSELQVQQEVLRQNAEEMEATQEQLQRTNQALENQIEEVQKATDRTRLLLENASEVITIYESDNTIRYISPSVEKILGYTQDEMIGFKDVAYVHSSGVEAYEQMFRDLLANPDERITIEFSYFTKSGERIWLEATGTNLLADPAIQGLVLNARDITERRAAEREQRLRGQMQALSENSPDLITRISKEGTVFYINPTIETYTGNNKDNYLQKHLRELELSSEILDSWGDIIKEVMTKNQKVSVDMDFPSVMGERVMQVNAIPEHNDQNNMESVLLVSHDITERKIIELEISQKNRKITESINYAKRIQEAILPDTNYIRQFLSQSFILYKPRDVVSGDFPWFLQKGDDIYIAAVDCTGHGVPGALISLIGFFLLNNIVNVHQVNNPGEILDLLDAEVTRTLRQDETDASSKDGMDISLCRINKKKMQIEYAGAHRPLYYMSEGNLLEIKGNKFPIGGAQYKNRGNFTNTIINYREKDAVFLFSDGFPDQFGGPRNKKFSPRKIRDIINGNVDKDISEINKVMEHEFEKWRGNNKQTDDVLMIGIKL